MKTLAIIFSFYILSLSAMPCADIAAVGNAADKTFPSAKAATHSEHDNDADACAPFCVCDCCGVFADAPFSESSFSSTDCAEDCAFSEHFVKPLSDFHSRIWQPPKNS